MGFRSGEYFGRNTRLAPQASMASRILGLRCEVVDHHDVAWLELRAERLLDIGQEPLAVDRPLQHHGRRKTIAAERRDEGGGLPARERDLVHEPTASRGAAPKPDHIVLGPGLVDEHQALHIERRLLFTPERPGFGDVRPVLLRGVQGFFLKLSRSRSQNRQTAP